MTNQEMQRLLRRPINIEGNRTSIPRENRKKVFHYLQSLGTNALSSNNTITDKIRAIENNENISRVDKEDIIDSLMNANLFKPFTSNRIKIYPKVSRTWRIAYRTSDVYSGYIVLENDENVTIQRVIGTSFFDGLIKGFVNDSGQLEKLNTNGSKLNGAFIVNHHRKLFSESFYNLWKDIHFPEEVEGTDTEGVGEVTRDNIQIGKYYKVLNATGSSLTIQKYLGIKKIVKYKIVNNQLVLQISNKRLAIEITLNEYSLGESVSEYSYGRVRSLSPFKKLKYIEELNDLPFLNKISEDQLQNKIETDFGNAYNLVGIYDELPANKKELGLKLRPSRYNERINVVVINNHQLLVRNNLLLPEATALSYYTKFSPLGIIKQDRNILGNLNFVELRGRDDYEQYGFGYDNLSLNRDLSNAFTFELIKKVDNGLRLNIIDDIIG